MKAGNYGHRVINGSAARPHPCDAGMEAKQAASAKLSDHSVSEGHVRWTLRAPDRLEIIHAAEQQRGARRARAGAAPMDRANTL